ncbi:MAG: RNA polymerase sigma-70 factor [Sphingobacteriales bacterium]|nr:RNA polymerase sigma-70 factor [Sphingobacteriales bacterium]OJV98437.1 MAG: hypothetical protein BGO52_11660 [Sphingobacteriales bacterium 44-61]
MILALTITYRQVFVKKVTFTDIESHFLTFPIGEDNTYDYFFRLYFKALCFFAQNILRDKYSPEDIVQDCFVKFWQKRAGIKNPESVKTYLYRMVRNACIDKLRSKELRTKIVPVPHDLSEEDQYIIYEDNLIKSELLRDIYLQMNELPDRIKQVFQLYYLQGKNETEIGQMLKTSPHTVRNQRVRGIALLRRKVAIS